MILNKENTFTEQNRFLVYSDQLNATRKQILDTAEEMISRSAIQTFEDEGETITATDASYLASLTVDGKAVQDGTPTPSSPVPVQVVAPINYLTGCDGESTGSYPFDHRYNSNPLVLPSVIPAGTIVVFSFDTVNNISTNFGIILVYADDSSKSIYTATDGTVGRKSKQITLEKDMKACGFYSVNASLIVANLQLEIGSTATPYIKAGCLGLKVSSTITPIDLQGNVLASLPDGTKDVLTVDSAGHCVLEKRTHIKTFDGTEDGWTQYTYTHGTGYYINAADFSPKPNVKTADAVAKTMCSAFICKSSNNASNPGEFYIDNSYLPNFVYPTATTLQSWKNYLASNPLTLLYQVDESTIDLGYIDMPAITDGSTISITAQVTPTIAVKWWTKNQSDVAAAFSAVSSDLAALQSEISALDARVTALESASAKTLVLEKLETSKEVESEDAAADEQEEMNLDDAE